MKILARQIVLGISLFTLGCAQLSSPSRPLIERIRNRGPVTLSSENPYLAANLLISREMERSEELRGFIKLRGAPPAIEVQSELFSPLLMFFYYPNEREYYELESLDDGWIIRGPLALSRIKMKEVAVLTRGIEGPPKLSFEGQTIIAAPIPNHESSSGLEPRFRREEEEEDPVVAKLAEKPKVPAKTDTKDVVRGAFQSPATELTLQPESETLRILKSDLGEKDPKDSSSSKLSEPDLKHPAELSPKGDLVHYVTYSGETLSMIARWYTQEASNAGKIARINNLKDANHLTIGDTVIVPSYMLKNRNRMTEEALKALQVLAEEGAY